MTYGEGTSMGHSHEFLVIKEYDEVGTDGEVEATWRCWRKDCQETTVMEHYSLSEFDEVRADANEALVELLMAERTA